MTLVPSARKTSSNAYYRLVDGDQRHYVDYTSCGNSHNVRHPQVLGLIMDSLRYWVEEMHVDGFRFDLAPVLARSFHEVDRLSAFFAVIQQDPVISNFKLIAEPWDTGEGGYQVENFPARWAEWNGRYRDTIRDFWRGAAPNRAEVARRLSGSPDLYQPGGRKPYASINYVTSHDGFTLHDQVSYERKHNEANGEDNRDGFDDNRSWNCGVEGPCDDPAVRELRERLKRNLLTTVLLSAGVPMLVAGDEMGRTQQGNNNPYCQDNDVSWIDWQLDERRKALLAFTRRVLALRLAHPAFRPREFFREKDIDGSGKDIGWFTPDGVEINETRWEHRDVHTLGVFFNGEAVLHTGPWGERISDDSFLLLLNGGPTPAAFVLPGAPWAEEYDLLFDTSNVSAATTVPLSDPKSAGESLQLEARSMAVLRAKRERVMRAG